MTLRRGVRSFTLNDDDSRAAPMLISLWSHVDLVGKCRLVAWYGDALWVVCLSAHACVRESSVLQIL